MFSIHNDIDRYIYILTKYYARYDLRYHHGFFEQLVQHQVHQSRYYNHQQKLDDETSNELGPNGLTIEKTHPLLSSSFLFIALGIFFLGFPICLGPNNCFFNLSTKNGVKRKPHNSL